MKRIITLLIFFVSATLSVKSQNFNTAVTNAFMVNRMVEKYHVQPRLLDKEFSENWFEEIINTLDNDKIFFTQEDINQLNVYRFQLHEQLRQKKSNFIEQLYKIYQVRLHQVDTIITNICKTPFDFTGREIFTAKEDSTFAGDTKKLRIKLYKHLKSAVLYNLVEMDEDEKFEDQKNQKKYNDSLEIIFRQKILSVYKRFIKRQIESPGGLTESIGNIYCKTLAECYDPHTEFFPLTEKENFESSLGNKKMIFGFKLDENEEGQVTIDHLKPGSPAFKSGQLNTGDKIIAIQWQEKESIDVSDASVKEISRILDASNDNKVTLTVKKSDGSTRQVVLAKEKEEDNAEDDGRMKSFLLKGTKTIGFISLPGFYTDFQDNNIGNEGCANDIAKEILKLKKEKIDGIIIDLRYNGGGSMTEATDLSGIFIDAGPVAQLERKDGKVVTVKDMNRGTIYDGPLLILVNGYSASASEMVAGTLQDYNRAIIVGTNTYGKATAQIILPLDTTINIEEDNHSIKKTDSYIKLTVEKLYRVTGNSAQLTGIVPDIILPEVEGIGEKKEWAQPHSLKAKKLSANKYFKPYPAIDFKSSKNIAKNIIDTNVYFKNIAIYNNLLKKYSDHKDVSLNLDTALAENKKYMDLFNSVRGYEAQPTNLFSVENNSYELIRLNTDKELSDINNQYKKHLSKDPYIQAAFQILSSILN